VQCRCRSIQAAACTSTVRRWTAREHSLALGQRQADLLEPGGTLLEGGHLLRFAKSAVIRCHLKQDPDPHGISSRRMT